jgi:hypothetical protein
MDEPIRPCDSPLAYGRTNSTFALASSRELARQRSALLSELRTGMSLARLWAENGQVDAPWAFAPLPTADLRRDSNPRTWLRPPIYWTNFDPGAEL